METLKHQYRTMVVHTAHARKESGSIPSTGIIHRLNICNPGSYFLGDLAKLNQYLICDNIPCWVFLVSFRTVCISPLFTQHGFNNSKQKGKNLYPHHLNTKKLKLKTKNAYRGVLQ